MGDVVTLSSVLACLSSVRVVVLMYLSSISASVLIEALV